MHTIVFLDRATIAPAITVRKPAFRHRWIDYDQTGADEACDRLKAATIAVVNKVPLRAETLERLPNLRMVAVAATGTDNIDIEACRKRGIVVSNIRQYASHTVPGHAFALILALRRSLVGFREDVKAGEWQKANQFCFFNHPVDDLHGSTLGIIGEGAIGQSVAAIGKAFGMETLYAAHRGNANMGPLYTPFEEVLARSDVITLHCPLTPATRNVISHAEFDRMTRKPLIINTARGGLIDEAALADALMAGKIAGAGIDVCSQEPPAADGPLMNLLDRPNFILTPHIAWASAQAMQTLADQLIDNIEAFERSSPRNVVV